MIDSGLMHQLSLEISTNTGLAPIYNIGSTEAIHVDSGTITSSPALIPIAKRAKWIAPVQLEVASANSLQIYFAKEF